MSARTQHKQFSRKDAPGDGGEYPLNSFPPNLAEVLKTKMLERKGFEILERLPCCWLLNTAPKQFAAEWITVWHFLTCFISLHSVSPALGSRRLRTRRRNPAQVSPTSEALCSTYHRGKLILCQFLNCLSSVPAFTVKIYMLLFKSEVEEERVFPGIKKRWVGFSHSFILAT